MKEFETGSPLNGGPPAPGGFLSAEAGALRSHLPLDAKLNLMRRRLEQFDPYEKMSLGEFIDALPTFEHMLTELAQSAVDICYSLLLDKTGAVPLSYYDIIDTCERRRILPARLVKRLARQLVLIDSGFETLDATQILDLHGDLAETGRVFRVFFEHSDGLREALAPSVRTRSRL